MTVRRDADLQRFLDRYNLDVTIQVIDPTVERVLRRLHEATAPANGERCPRCTHWLCQCTPETT